MDGSNYNIKFYNRSTKIPKKNSLRLSKLSKNGIINNQAYRNSLKNSNLYNSFSVNKLSSVIPNQNQLTSQIINLYRYETVPTYTTLQNTNLSTNYNDTRENIQMTSNPNSIVFLPIQTSSSSDFIRNSVSMMNNSYIQQPALLNNGLNISYVNSPYFVSTSLQPVSFINASMPMVLYNGYNAYLSNNQPNYGVGQYILNYPITNLSSNNGVPTFYQDSKYSRYSSESIGYELDSYEPDVDEHNTSMEIALTKGSTQEIKSLNINSNKLANNYNLNNNLPLTENQTIIEDKNYTYKVVSENVNVNQIEELPSKQYEVYKNNDTNIDFNSNEIYSSNEYTEYKFEPLETKSDNNIINYESTIIEPKVEELDYTNINTTESIPEEKTVYVQEPNIDLINVENTINSGDSNNYTTLSTKISNPSKKKDTYTTNTLELDSIEKNDNLKYLDSNPIDENNIISSIEYISEPSKNNNSYVSKPLESESIKKNYNGYYLPIKNLENNNVTPVNKTINPLKSYDISSNLLELDSLNKIYDSYQLTSNPVDNNYIATLTKSIPIKKSTKKYDSYQLNSNPVETNNIISTDSTSNQLNENYIYASEQIISDPLKKSNNSYLLTSNKF